MKASWVRSFLRGGERREAAAGGRHLGSGKRAPFTRPPRNRSRRPPNPCVEIANSDHASGAEDATGVPEASVRFARDGVRRHRAGTVRVPKWELRRETRLSPASFASGGPEPPGALFPRLRTGGESREDYTSRERARAARLGTRASPVRAPKGLTRDEHAALGNDGVWVLELKCFGVQKSIGRIAGLDARGRYQAHLGHARPSSKETHAAQ